VPAALANILFQAVLVAGGNLSYLNWLTVVPALWCLDDSVVAPLFGAGAR
jgi:hypothetical protein